MAGTATRAPSAPARKPRRFRPFDVVASWWPAWSPPAAYRAVRATIVIPVLLAITSEVLGNPQMALFGVFGGFATLVLANFGGSRRDKLVAHGTLAISGSVLLVIGTVVSSPPALAAGVTVPIAFVVLFSGVIGPNAANGATAALLGYVLPAATPGTVGVIPTRLAGWWLASAAGTLAVLLLSPRSPGDRLRAAAATSAASLGDQIDAALASGTNPASTERVMQARGALNAAFMGASYRPTGLALRGLALARLVGALDWCTTLVGDLVREVPDLSIGTDDDRRLLADAARVLHHISGLLAGGDGKALAEAVGDADLSSGAEVPTRQGRSGPKAVHVAFHARIIAAAVRSAADEAAAAAPRTAPRSRADPLVQRRRGGLVAAADASVARLLTVVRRRVQDHSSVRSVWFLNSARGAVALAAAVAVADLTDVQHGFWVVLGALSVLRTSAASTGANALRAIVGTAVGFAIGGGLIVVIGTDPVRLWVLFPLALLIAAYTPGTAPFAVGQAAFTLMISMLYNILVPIGWKVGVIRVEDVALGAAVSAVVGLLFWPRGALAVVSDDLADAFHRGGVYLVQATAWVLGARRQTPDADQPAFQATLRLQEALRSLLSEQSSKPVPKDQLWRLVGGTSRLRLTARSLASLSPPAGPLDGASQNLVGEAVHIAGECDVLAAQLSRSLPTAASELAPVSFGDPTATDDRDCVLWVRQYLDHVQASLADLGGAAATVAARRAAPWWR